MGDFGSFRDPSGFIYERDGVLLRQVNRSYSQHWDSLTQSGLLDRLVADGMLIDAKPADLGLAATPDAVAVLQPERVPLVSYPYEWSFSQLREAARLTLAIMRRALDAGFWLKDASAFNVQFLEGKPIFIDTLSFEPYREGEPWPGYGQFCRHFLAPLALSDLVHPNCLKLLTAHIDGIPLDLASRALPWATKLRAGLAAHIHLHALATSNAQSSGRSKRGQVSKQALLGMIDSLQASVDKLRPPNVPTRWGDYYGHTNYSNSAFEAKKAIVGELLSLIQPRPSMVWDLGANTGVFSEVAAKTAEHVVAWDGDPIAVEAAYRKWKGEGRTNLLPLVQDFANPSPALGWACRERKAFGERAPADATLSLALVHHLAIGNNVPLPEVARWLASLGEWAIVEFVPKTDSQVVEMLAAREDVFPTYSPEGFSHAFGGQFEEVTSRPVPETQRTIHLFRRRGAA